MKICVIGGGNMGGAIANGMAQGKKIAGEDITVINRTMKKYGYGIVSKANEYDVISTSDIVILAVKPWLIESIIGEHLHLFNKESQIIISVAAGVSLDQLSSYFKESKSLFRVMPNTAVEVRKGVSFICSKHTSIEQVDVVSDLFRELGSVEFIDEHLFAAATSIASCGIAYAFKYIRASMQAGVELGLTVEQAKKISIQTVLGAASLLEAKDSHPEVEIDKVTTPGGITIKGLNELEHSGFTSAVVRALKASCF